MKTRKNLFKNLLVLTMALVMTLAMSITAFAAGTHKLTVTPAADGHTHNYAVYQVFSGDKAGSVLANIKWADGVNKTDLINALKTTTFSVTTTFTDDMYATDDASAAAAEFAKLVSDADKALLASVIANHLGTAAGNMSGTSTSPASITTLEDGFYFVKETTTGLSDSAYTRFILTLVDETAIDAKSVMPTVEKKINEGGSLVDGNAASVGDTINYVVSSFVPDTTGYSTYEMVFTDTLSKGLTFNASSVAITTKTGTYPETTLDTSKYTVVSSTDSVTKITTVTIKLTDLKDAVYNKGDVIKVVYSATLNSDADLTTDGNSNKVKLTYSNNPADSTSKGTTPEDKVVTYATTLKIKKVDESSAVLTGAKFKVEKYDAATSTWNEILAETAVDSSGELDVTGLGAGKYRITETQEPTGYNKITTPIEVTIAAVMDGTDPSVLDKWTYSQEGHTYATTAAEAGTHPVVGITTVVNKQGIVLPSTGGIGTTIFYVAGAILVIVAAIVLITRKRMADEE